MDLREYLFKKNISGAEFSRQLGVHHSTLTGILNGKKISFRMAKKISDASCQNIGLEDLLPDVYSAMVDEFLRKEHEKYKKKASQKEMQYVYNNHDV